MTVALLIEMAWKSGLVAALALAGAALLRGRPPAERVAFLRLAIVVVFALPLLAVLVPALRIETPAPRAEVAAPLAAHAAAAAPAVARRPAAPEASTVATARTPAPPSAPRVTPVQVLVGLYAAGVVVLLLRLLAGVAGLTRLTRRAAPVTDRRWLAALDRAASAGPRPALRATPRIRSPLSWGWRPGVILINADALHRPECADAVLTHEMGHVRHADWLFLMLSRVLVALLWFNPMVWLLQRELSHQSEQAADAWAVRRIDRADYAGVLVAMARCTRPQAALGMAAPHGELARRVAAVLSIPPRRGRPWPTVLAAAACVAFATPLAAVDLARAAPEARSPAPARVLPVEAAAAPLAAAVETPAAFAPPPRAATDPTLTADERAAVLRQRALGLAMMDEGVRHMEAALTHMRRQADLQPMSAEERAGLLRDADALEADIASLRQEAAALAARDVSSLRPLTAGEETELAAGLEEIRSIPPPVDMPPSAPAEAPAPLPSTPQREGAPLHAPPAPAAPEPPAPTPPA